MNDLSPFSGHPNDVIRQAQSYSLAVNALYQSLNLEKMLIQ